MHLYNHRSVQSYVYNLEGCISRVHLKTTCDQYDMAESL